MKYQLVFLLASLILQTKAHPSNPALSPRSTHLFNHGALPKCSENDNCQRATGHFQYRHDCEATCYCVREDSPSGGMCEGTCDWVKGWNMPMWVCKPVWTDFSAGTGGMKEYMAGTWGNDQ